MVQVFDDCSHVSYYSLWFKFVWITFRENEFILQNNYIQAVTDFTKAIELNPKYADAFNNRAVSYFALLEYDKAWADVHVAEELGANINPNFISDLKKSSGRDE